MTNCDTTLPHQLTVVLADDNADILEQLQSILAPDFHVVESAADGAALVEAARRRRPDAVVCYIEMPVLSGIDAGRVLIQEGCCACVVALTMYRDRELVEKALAAGIRGYVLKLDAADELIPALRSVVSGSIYLSGGVRTSH